MGFGVNVLVKRLVMWGSMGGVQCKRLEICGVWCKRLEMCGVWCKRLEIVGFGGMFGNVGFEAFGDGWG